jgi:hypothetical protein
MMADNHNFIRLLGRAKEVNISRMNNTYMSIILPNYFQNINCVIKANDSYDEIYKEYCLVDLICTLRVDPMCEHFFRFTYIFEVKI